MTVPRGRTPSESLKDGQRKMGRRSRRITAGRTEAPVWKRRALTIDQHYSLSMGFVKREPPCPDVKPPEVKRHNVAASGALFGLEN